MRRYLTLLALGAAILGAPAVAQLGLPRLSLPPLSVPTLPLSNTLDTARETVGETVQRLMTARIERADRLLKRFPDLIELDARGEPARRGELLLLDTNPAELRAALSTPASVAPAVALNFDHAKLAIQLGFV